MSFGDLALLLPETSKADRGAEFPRFGLLLLRDRNGCEETGFGFRFDFGVGGRRSGARDCQLVLTCLRVVSDLSETCPGLLQRQFTFETVYLCFMPTFVVLLYQS